MTVTGRKFTLYVTHAEETVNGWLSVWGHEDNNYLSSIQELIKSLSSDLKVATRNEIREAYKQHDIVCVSMSSERDVRGRIVRLEEASNTASVYLIDLGKMKTVLLDNIKMIPDNDRGLELRAMEEKSMDYILANITPIASKWNDANLYLLKIRLQSGGIPVECYSTKKYPRLLRCELNDSLLAGLADDEVIQIVQPKNIERWLVSLDPSGIEEIGQALEGLAIGSPATSPDGAGGERKRFTRREDEAIVYYVLERCQHPQDALTKKLFEEASKTVEVLGQRSGNSLYHRFHRYLRPAINEFTDDQKIITLWKPQ